MEEFLGALEKQIYPELLEVVFWKKSRDISGTSDKASIDKNTRIKSSEKGENIT